MWLGCCRSDGEHLAPLEDRIRDSLERLQQSRTFYESTVALEANVEEHPGAPCLLGPPPPKGVPQNCVSATQSL